jgi:hypothetical protein
VVAAEFEILFVRLQRVTAETHENRQAGRFPGRNLNPGQPNKKHVCTPHFRDVLWLPVLVRMRSACKTSQFTFSFVVRIVSSTPVQTRSLALDGVLQGDTERIVALCHDAISIWLYNIER